MRRGLGFALLCLAACASRAPRNASPPTPSLAQPARSSPSAQPWTEEQRAQASASLSSLFSSPLLRDAGLVVLGADGTTLFARNATQPLTPASSMKILVAATALDVLGPARRFETAFEAREPPQADGTLEGPLWLVGGGDPLLSADDLRGGAAVLARSGLRHITGGLVVDATAFGGPEQNPQWDPADLDYDYAAGTSAISLDEDVVEFRVVPTAPGEAARIEVRPPSTTVGFTGSIATAPQSDDSDVSIVRDAPAPGDPSDRNAFIVGGHIAAGVPQSFFKPVLGIASFAGGAAAAMLADRGISLEGGVDTGPAPFAARPLWSHRSRPLAELLREMLVFSDNHTAEQLLRMLGFEVAHSGTERSGIRVERAYLQRNGIDPRGLHVVDGSGLSGRDHVPPLLLARVLAAALHAVTSDAFLRALPLVGVEGTVRHHDLTFARGRARAKSGHIDEVNALAGTVQTRHHGRVTFAFLVNGPFADAGAVTSEEDGALDALARL